MNPIEMQSIQAKKPRPYRRITAAVVARMKSEAALQGNNTAAVRILEPDLTAPEARAYKIMNKGKEVGDGEYIDTRMARLAVKAVDRIDDLIESTDERVAQKSAHFVYEHARGKAVQRSESASVNINIQQVLE